MFDFSVPKLLLEFLVLIFPRQKRSDLKQDENHSTAEPDYLQLGAYDSGNDADDGENGATQKGPPMFPNCLEKSKSAMKHIGGEQHCSK